ncbi:MAG: hypothetical protein GX620_09575 [Chloroflexi bacterium]|nr:hypothetical protein [Chloroflexota bacterium]
MAKLHRLTWLDTRRLIVAITFVSLFAMAVRAPADTDTWWHLQAGKMTLESGRILQTDVFSHTRYGASWVNHSWLTQVWLYGLFKTCSYAGLGIWIGVIVTVTFLFVFLQMDGDPFVKAFIILLAAMTSSVIWVARPQLVSLLLTAVVAYILHLFKWRRTNRLWLLPPLFVLWVNLHAGYALGFMVLAAFVAGELLNHVLSLVLPSDDPVTSWRGLATVVGVSFLSALVLVINPNTTRMWTYYLDTVRIGVLQDFIQEWRSPDFHHLYMQPFIWLLLSTLAAVGLSGRRIDGVDLALVCGFAYSALLAGRNIAPFAVIVAPTLSRHANTALGRLGWSLRPRPAGDMRLRKVYASVNWLLLTLLVALAGVKIVTPLSTAANEQLERKTLPVGAVEWIAENRPAGEMFNHYNWGGYLIWKLWPEHRVFVDGRTDLYGDEILREYMAIQTARPDALQLLDAYGVSFVLTGAHDALSVRLDCQPDWVLRYEDDLSSLWQRVSR